MLRFNTKVGAVKKDAYSTSVLQTHVAKRNVGRNKLQKKCLQPQVGFSLIELMVAVAIIGILAAIAIPNYQAFQRRARQAEARTMLSGIFTAEKSFIAEWGAGTTDLQGIGFYPEGQLGYIAGFDEDSVQVGTAPICNDGTPGGAGPGNSGTPIRYTGAGLNFARRHTGNLATGVCDGPGSTLAGTATCINLSGKTNIPSGVEGIINGTSATQIVHSDAAPTSLTNVGTAADSNGISAACNNGNFIAIAYGNIGAISSATGETRDDVWTITHDKILTNHLSGV